MGFPIVTVIIIVAVLAGLLAAWPLSRAGLHPRRGQTAAAIGLAIIGAALIVLNGRELDSALTRRQWPTVTGTVVDSHLAGERAFHAVVVYEFTHHNTLQTDTCRLYQPSFGGKRKRHEVAKQMLAPYYPGAVVTVHINPEQPDESTLDLSVHWSTYGQAGLGGVLLALGVCLVLMWGFGARSRPLM